MEKRIEFTNRQFQFMTAMLAMILITIALCLDKLETSQATTIYAMALAYVFGYTNGNKAKSGG